MNWLSLQTVAQIAVERVLNALPEGFLIALCAWALLRVLRRQNSGTRFAVWFLALLTVATLPLVGGFSEGRAIGSAMAWDSARPAITIPGRWALMAFLVWALGTCVAMVRLAAGFWRLRGLRRSCTPIVAADLDPAVRKTLGAIGAGSVTIATSECVRVPAAIGFWKRTIVLPAWSLRELAPEDLNVVLLHEFAHLRRGDEWTNLIQKVVRSLFFFHPAVWWIEKRLSVEREMACDDAVLAETANPHRYANCLVSLLEKSLAHRLSDQSLADKRWSMAQAAVHRAREASLRLAQILDANRPLATRVWKPALGMIGAFSVVCLAVLPHAPQLVAFDPGAMAGNSSHAYSAALSQPALPSLASSNGELGASARVLDASTSPKAASRDSHRSIARPHFFAAHSLAPAQTVARLNAATPPRERVVKASANTDQEIVPQLQTLVFIEATQYGSSDSSSSVWRVRVWRMIFVSAVRERAARAPVANST